MNAPSALRVPLSRRTHDRLHRVALRYGLSLPELSHRILDAVASEIPEEHIEGYERPRALRTSLRRALRDLHAGRISTTL